METVPTEGPLAGGPQSPPSSLLRPCETSRISWEHSGHPLGYLCHVAEWAYLSRVKACLSPRCLCFTPCWLRTWRGSSTSALWRRPVSANCVVREQGGSGNPLNWERRWPHTLGDCHSSSPSHGRPQPSGAFSVRDKILCFAEKYLQQEAGLQPYNIHEDSIQSTRSPC